MFIVKPHNHRSIGQATIEIAIFGAILIFLMGTIIRNHLLSTQGQRNQIKAVKLALLNSYKSSVALTSSRNNASVLFLEDRLSPDVNKFGPSDRVPFIASSGGTMSNRLFYPIDCENTNTSADCEITRNLPIMDMYINGQHFAFTTAAFVFRTLPNPSIVSPCQYFDGTPMKDPDLSNCQRILREEAAYCHNPTSATSSPAFFTHDVNGTAEWCVTTDPAQPCSSNGNVLTTQQSFDLGRIGIANTPPTPSAPPVPADCLNGSSNPEKCRYNYMAWQWFAVCANSTTVNNKGTQPVDGTFYSRIDFGGSGNPQTPQLDTNGDFKEEQIYFVSFQDPTKIKTTLQAIHGDFFGKNDFINGTTLNITDEFLYQSKADLSPLKNILNMSTKNLDGSYGALGLVRGTPPDLLKSLGTVQGSDFYSLGYDATSVLPLLADLTANGYINNKNIIQGKFTALSISSDMVLGSAFMNKRDQIYQIMKNDLFSKPVTGVVALDSTMGDINSTFDPKIDIGMSPGFQSNMRIYTQTSPGGTYLEIKEGNALNPETQQVVRSVSSKDEVSLLSRELKLSNNTGRFCTMDNYRQPTVDGENNPVQVCATDCIGGGNLSKTCFNTSSLILYVRANIGDKHTRKWFTDTTKGL